MKQITIVIILTIFSIAAHAAEPLKGYIVMANNDTIQCKIKSGRFLNNPFYGITIINEQGEDEAFNSRDRKIIAFGFTEKLNSFHYLFVDVGDKLESGYYQLIVNGPHYKLYGRPTTLYGGNPTYVLFNQNRDFTKFEPCVVCPWKKQLRELLKDDPKALEHIENASRVDIPRFVTEINKL